MEFRNWLEASAAARGVAKPITAKPVYLYGYWLSPNGILYPVHLREGHENEAKIIAAKYFPTISLNWEEDGREYYWEYKDLLLKKNWARIITNESIQSDMPLTKEQINTILKTINLKNGRGEIYIDTPQVNQFVKTQEELFNTLN